MDWPVIILDAVSTLAFLCAFVGVCRMRRADIGLPAGLFLGLSVAVYVFVGVSNLLEHTGSTNLLDPYEDYAEILFLPFILFFVLSLQSQREQQGRAQVETALRRSEARYRTLVENIELGISLISADYEILMTNTQIGTMLNKPACEFVGMRCFEEFEKRDAVCPHCPGRVAMATGGSASVETEGVRGDGTRIPVRLRAFPLLNPDGTAAGFIEIVEDITEHKQMEEERRDLERQMQHAQKLESLGVLAGGIAHDFNNILMAILGNADLALYWLHDHDPSRENVREIKRAARRAAELAKQMLAYSGRGTFVIEPIRLNELVGEMGNLLEVSIPKNAILRNNFTEALPTIEGDAAQIRQIVMNLIVNAAEAVDEKGGTITVTTGAMDCDRDYLDSVNEILRAGYDAPLPEGLYVYAEVADSGCGMDAETQARMFDPFFTTKFQGRGLGLAAVLGIVRSHRGAIQIYSEPGKGTTIKVLFPAADGSGRPAKPATNDLVESHEWRGSGTVLIADDEETVRSVGRQMLELMGFDVIAVTDGREAVGAFREHAEDIVCVLIDLTMPNLNGRETFREIRRVRPDAAVVLTSGYHEDEATRSFTGKGLAGFIQKPYQLNQLRQILRRILGETPPPGNSHQA